MKKQDLNFFLNFGKKSLLVIAQLPLVAGLLWSIGLCVCRPICAPLLLLAGGLILFFKTKHHAAFPLRGAFALALIAAITGFVFLPAPSGETWDKPWERAPLPTIGDSTVHLRNIRDFEFYTTKTYDVRYLEENFNLDELHGVHLIESRRRDVLPGCDLLFSFVFNDGRTLVFGPELRLPLNEEINVIQAYYKCYGLLYVFGTEEDMLRLRTDKKHEYLSFHTLRVTQKQAKDMLLNCVRISAESQQDNEAYSLVEGQYNGPMQEQLRALCPQLPYTLNEKVASKLFEAGLLVTRDGETWETYQRRCAVGFDLTDNRKAYSTVIRRIAGIDPLPAIPKKRRVQEESLSVRPMREIMQVESEFSTQNGNDGPEDAANKSIFSHGTPFTTGKGSALAEKIPEPGERLTVDTRDYSDAEYNSDTDNTTNTYADSILEPKARMQADEMLAAANAEQKEKERKAAAEGRFKKKRADGKDEALPEIDYDNMLLGRKSSGIKIIEKEKPAEETHPLDPYRRRNPFEEEKKKKPSDEEVDDLTAKPKPLHL